MSARNRRSRPPPLRAWPADMSGRRWGEVVEFFQQGAPHGPRSVAMAALVERIAASPLAPALHPSTSHYLLRLFAQERFSISDDQIQVEHDGDAFEVRYLSAPRVRSASLAPITSHWRKRGPDGMALLQRCLHHLRWVVEEHPTHA